MSEESDFREAFAAAIAANPDVAPSPTALNHRLGTPKRKNTLNGRMNLLRKELLIEAGFFQHGKWGRWKKYDD